MALLDVCGFHDTTLFPRWTHQGSSTFSDGTMQLGELSKTLKAQVGGNPFHFLFPFQQNNFGHRFNSTLCSTPCPVPLSHGTTTLGFMFQGGVIAAADTRASCAGLIACPSAQKIIPIHSHLVTTSSGSGADCVLWERILTREIRLYQLRYGRRLTVNGAAKLLSLMLHPFKGTNVCVALTLVGWDVGDATTDTEICKRLEDDREVHSIPFEPSLLGEPGNARLTSSSDLHTLKEKTLLNSCQGSMIPKKTSGNPSQHNTELGLCGPRSVASSQSGPRLCYVCSDGLRLKGDLISVGSGSPYAYSVLDDGWRWGMSVDEAIALAREAVCKATYRDAYSGNNVDLFHITEHGWRCRPREDVKEEYFRQKNAKARVIQPKEQCK